MQSRSSDITTGVPWRAEGRRRSCHEGAGRGRGGEGSSGRVRTTATATRPPCTGSVQPCSLTLSKALQAEVQQPGLMKNGLQGNPKRGRKIPGRQAVHARHLNRQVRGHDDLATGGNSRFRIHCISLKKHNYQAKNLNLTFQIISRNPEHRERGRVGSCGTSATSLSVEHHPTRQHTSKTWRCKEDNKNATYLVPIANVT